MSEQTETSVGIVIVSHADLGQAMLRGAELLLGQQYDCAAISIDNLHDVSETVTRLDAAANR